MVYCRKAWSWRNCLWYQDRSPGVRHYPVSRAVLPKGSCASLGYLPEGKGALKGWMWVGKGGSWETGTCSRGRGGLPVTLLPSHYEATSFDLPSAPHDTVLPYYRLEGSGLLSHGSWKPWLSWPPPSILILSDTRSRKLANSVLSNPAQG